MNPSHSKNISAFWFAFAANAALGLYFAKGVKALHPPHFLLLGLLLGGLLLGLAFFAILKKGQGVESKSSNLIPFAAFQIVQGLLGFALCRFVFHLSLSASCAYPLGAAVGFLFYWILNSGLLVSSASMALSLVGAFAFALSLRLLGVFGGLLFAGALLNGFYPGLKSLGEKPVEKDLWTKALFFTALLAAARAAIQYYLVESYYASLGVVITHPYTFAALFAGFLIPPMAAILVRDRLMPKALVLILFGILFPLALGIFIHVRPMAAYLLGLSAGSFLSGIIFLSSLTAGVMVYLSLAAVAFSLPLYQDLIHLSRVMRLEILGGVFFLTVIFFLLFRLFQAKRA